MHLLPMASSPDGLISAQYAVITKTPGWGVLKRGGGGVNRQKPSPYHPLQQSPGGKGPNNAPTSLRETSSRNLSKAWRSTRTR